jgi:protein-tyrosine phosphatase
VVFVCLGNICRSPMADVVMQSLLAGSELDGLVEVASAGTGDWHVGGRADERAVAALARRGYNGAAHRARQFSADWFAEYDLVFALDRSNRAALLRMAPPRDQSKVRLLRDFDPEAGADLEVPDPYYGGDDAFDDVLAMVERSCVGLLDHIRHEITQPE